MMKILKWFISLAILGLVCACGFNPATAPSATPQLSQPAFNHPSSSWVAADWADLPGWDQQNIAAAWQALLQSCKAASTHWKIKCGELQMQLDDQTRRTWLMANFRPYQIQDLSGRQTGLLTAYFEPVFAGSRLRRQGFQVPLYRLPEELKSRRSDQRWWSRNEIETRGDVQRLLKGLEIAWLADPVDAMVLHVQGSGKLKLSPPGGGTQYLRVAFAGTNNHGYISPAKWLIDRGLTRDASWKGIKAYLAEHPDKEKELLTSNPRYVFFQLEEMPAADSGPKGAQGVPLTAGGSIAVDPKSIPYGSPVWISADGSPKLQKLVVAQDTGNAISGAIRADYFAGSGEEAGQLAGKIKHVLRMWILWPK
jgi:membrane-bound lytic murein transglycosylase A